MAALIIHPWYLWAALACASFLGIITLLLRELNKMSAEEMDILVKQPAMTDAEAQLVVNEFVFKSNHYDSENETHTSKT